MKNKKWVSVLLWVLAFVLTLGIAVYQRLTGPTHPVKAQETINGKTIDYRLLRSHTAHEALPVTIKAPDENITAWLSHKRYKSGNEWTEVEMTRDGEYLKAEIPGEAWAGKVEYTVRIHVGDQDKLINQGQSVVARFKGAVPTVFLIIHVILMFVGILFAVRTALETLRKGGEYFRLVNWTLGILLVGGMILGPIVQKYAFGDLWTGFPFGYDLTDNKVLIAVIFWVAAFFLKKKSKWWVLAAAVIMLIIYLIPHSVLGSELDYESGKMKNKYSMNRVESKTYALKT